MKLPLNTKHKTMITDKSKYEAMNSKLPQAISFYALLVAVPSQDFLRSTKPFLFYFCGIAK